MVKLVYDNRMSEWTRIDSRNRVWLAPRGANPLPTGNLYELRHIGERELEVRAVAKAKGPSKR
jgi:hypothetical protein